MLGQPEASLSSFREALWMCVGIASFFLLVTAALWFIYSMDHMVDIRIYTHHEAALLVSKMGMVTTGLTVASIFIVRLLARPASTGHLVFTDSLSTGFALAGYTAINVMWRQRWEPNSQGPAFLPPWSDLNAQFFSEYDWLSYLLFLTPFAMLSAAGISSIFAKLAFKKMHHNR